MKSVKTNIHYLVTSNQKDLIRLQGILIDNYDINLYEKAEQWTKRLIDIVQPKCIICEGAYSATRIAEYYGENVVWNNDVCTFKIMSKLPVVGYKRKYAGIINKDELQKEICVVYKQLLK